jgi:hypothetical protein
VHLPPRPLNVKVNLEEMKVEKRLPRGISKCGVISSSIGTTSSHGISEGILSASARVTGEVPLRHLSM